jgi:hypothetical protein
MRNNNAVKPRKKPNEKKENVLINQSDIDKTTDLEKAFATTRCLPKWEDIPEEFKKELYTGTLYNRVIDSWFCGSALPNAGIVFNPGFEAEPKKVFHFIMAHLRSFEPKHEHKIAGCAYLLSQIMTLKE